MMVLMLAPNTAAPTAAQPALERIAFLSDRDGNNEIYVMSADGSNPTRLTNTPAPEDSPAWSPNGSRIVFVSGRDGNNEIYVMNANGSRQTRLTDNPGNDFTPSWSPDGRRIVFSSTRDGNPELYVMNVDGSNPTRLTDNPAAEVLPAWSPDGRRIAFQSNRDGNFEVYVMSADGSSQTRLTNSPNFDAGPTWSPDGTRLAYNSNDGSCPPSGEPCSGAGFEVYVMNTDGTGQRRLTNNPGNDISYSWSPDGTRIAFFSRRDPTGQADIYLIRADGSGEVRLTNSEDNEVIPRFAPRAGPVMPLPNTSVSGAPLLFPETGYSLEGDFLSYWRAHGGLSAFGYPIDSARDSDGRVVQYLERARFELYPQQAAPYRVLLGRLGVEALERQGRAWQDFPKASPSAAHYFSATGHAIAPQFWGYWSSHGLESDGRRGTSLAESLALFGYPISDLRIETDAGGDRVLTQWFERARFEYRPDMPAAYRVLLGRLGAETQSTGPR
jgi:Tol biopolymer transport system component